MSIKDFTTFYNKNKRKNEFRYLIDDVIKTIDFTNNYKRDVYKNNKIGILQKINNNWIWSWVNTINTNYSCIFTLIKESNKFLDEKISIESFELNFDNTLKNFRNILFEKKELFFNVDSEIFNEMMFITQNSWNNGICSIISSFYTLNKNLSLTHTLNYERGNNDDMTNGIDTTFFVNNVEKTLQHKRLNGRHMEMDGDFYYFYDFYYNKSYEKLDYLSIERDGFIYLIENIDVQYGNKLNQLIVDKKYVKRMIMEKDYLTDILLEINKLCFEQKIIFIIDKDDSELNKFEKINVDNKNGIRLILNNPMDENLYNILNEELEKLKNLIK
jgi:hypothetical protein